MKTNSILSLSITFLLLLSFGETANAQNEKVNLSTFSFTVPDGMKNHPTDESILAKLSFENSLHITIDDNMEKMLSSSKQSPMAGMQEDMEGFAFDLKFKAIKEWLKNNL